MNGNERLNVRRIRDTLLRARIDDQTLIFLMDHVGNKCMLDVNDAKMTKLARNS